MHFLRSTAYVVILKVNFTAGEPETYIIPLMITSVNYANEVTADYPGAVIARLKMPDENPDQICFDAMVDRNYCSFLLKSINQEKSFKGLSGEIVAKSTRAYSSIHGLTESVLVPQPVKTEQTNTSVFYGHQAILKLFRCIGDGVNPELVAVSHRKNFFCNFAHFWVLSTASPKQ
jgi:maltose alpha-D-glucosyltransferase/alpha-amylase